MLINQRNPDNPINHGSDNFYVASFSTTIELHWRRTLLRHFFIELLLKRRLFVEEWLLVRAKAEDYALAF